jgi:serine/threonine protein kinase
MKTADHQRLVEIFNAALELPADERPQFISRECAADAELCKEVESLLAFHDDEFLEEDVSESVMEVLRGGLLPGHVICDRFEIIETLGRGGMGVVYLAHDHKLKRPVALKALAAHLSQDKRRVKSSLQEALDLSQIKHEHILHAYDHVEDHGTSFIVTEYVKGMTLRRKLQAGPLDLATALGIAREMALALEAAHAKGFVHQDIKPENVIVQEDGHVKVLDFGIAKLTEPEPREDDEPSRTGVSQTQGMSGFGTESYVSCEQVLGEKVDHRTDIWSLGVCLYEMLAGVPPFKGEKPIKTYAAIIMGDPAPLGKNVPEELKGIVKKALHKDRNERYQNMLEFRSDLEKVSPEQPGKRAARADSRVDTLKGWRRTRGKTIWWGLLLGATLSLLLAVALAAAIYPFDLFNNQDPKSADRAAEVAQAVVSACHLILLIVALGYFYKHPGAKGFRPLASDLQHDNLRSDITDSTGYVKVEDWKRARCIAEDALKDYRGSFVFLLVAWFILYSVALLRPFVEEHFITSLFTQANNFNTLCIWSCFRILNEPITTENRADNSEGMVIRALKAQTVTILIIFLLMFLWFSLEAGLTKSFADQAKSLPKQAASLWERGESLAEQAGSLWKQSESLGERVKNIHLASKLLSGICGGVAMALFVGRFQSKFVKSTDKSTDESTNKSTDWMIVIFYLYTVIQTLFIFYGDDSVQGKWWAAAIMQSALYLKCLLILYTFWLFQTGRLLFYLVRVRRASDQVDSEWLKFRDVLRPEG